MTALQAVDFLADIQFIDYKDAEFLLENDAGVNSFANIELLNIQFMDYWDAEFGFDGSDICLENWDTEIALEDWDADVSCD